MKKVVEKRSDIAFYVKLFPLPSHKDSAWKAKSMICRKSLNMLEDNFSGKPIAKVECDTKEIDDNIKLGASVGINSTPTLIMPDGHLHSGTLPADQLIKLIINGRK